MPGPGDPGLLTVRGAELLAAADVVVHDRLVDPRLLGWRRPGRPRRRRQAAGRLAGDQEAINELLVELGRRHDVVVRLKGGDPYVFGRGGEEADALARRRRRIRGRAGRLVGERRCPPTPASR